MEWVNGHSHIGHNRNDCINGRFVVPSISYIPIFTSFSFFNKLFSIVILSCLIQPMPFCVCSAWDNEYKIEKAFLYQVRIRYCLFTSTINISVYSSSLSIYCVSECVYKWIATGSFQSFVFSIWFHISVYLYMPIRIFLYITMSHYLLQVCYSFFCNSDSTPLWLTQLM